MTTLRHVITGALTAALLTGTLVAQETSGTRSFTVAKGGTLHVRLSTGSIRLETWDKNSIEFGGGTDPREWKVNQESGDIQITENMMEGSGGEDLALRIPRDCNVEIRTSAGDIEMRGTLNGEFHGQTSGGDIQLGDVGRQLDVATAGGMVVIGDIGGEGRIISSGGDIRVGDVARALDASTAGGNVAIGDVGGDARVNSSGGDIRAGKVAGKASLKTAGGNIDLRSATGNAQLTTSGGDVTAHEVTGSIAAMTAGGNVQVTLIPSGKGNSRLNSAGGDITLALPSNARATIDAVIRLEGRDATPEEYQIHSDFPAERKDQQDNRHEIHEYYQLNGGGEQIEVSTVNSNIFIKKAGR